MLKLLAEIKTGDKFHTERFGLLVATRCAYVPADSILYRIDVEANQYGLDYFSGFGDIILEIEK